jgi:hypothetical protein
MPSELPRNPSMTLSSSQFDSGLAGTKIMCNDQRYGCTNSSVSHNSGDGQATERRGS